MNKKPLPSKATPSKPMMSDKASGEKSGEKNYLIKKATKRKDSETEEEVAISKKVLGDHIGDDPETALEEIRQKIQEKNLNLILK